MSVYTDFLKDLQEAILGQRLVKLSLGNYKGLDNTLKNVYIKPVLLKQELKLSFVYRYATKDITKNYSLEDATSELEDLTQFKGFRRMHAQLLEADWIMQMNKKGEWRLDKTQVSGREQADLTHDHKKERRLTSSKQSYLQDLKLTDAEGQVFKNAQDKWKQINHYIELLSGALEGLPQQEQLNVVDMGAGKGYLTFALYDYLQHVLQRNASVIGVEFRKDLVDFCNQVAEKASFSGLHFVEGTIADFKADQGMDVLIALHACDTATDDAIYQGIQQEASLIVVAPCCHKQVRRELEAVKAKNDLDFMTKHGIFLERHAEMLTDSIRALIMEYYGYETKVMQFIADQHTPKNVMIVASKRNVQPNKQAEILAKLQSLKSYFGIGYQHLERLCGLDK